MLSRERTLCLLNGHEKRQHIISVHTVITTGFLAYRQSSESPRTCGTMEYLVPGITRSSLLLCVVYITLAVESSDLNIPGRPGGVSGFPRAWFRSVS